MEAGPFLMSNCSAVRGIRPGRRHVSSPPLWSLGALEHSCAERGVQPGFLRAGPEGALPRPISQARGRTLTESPVWGPPCLREGHWPLRSPARATFVGLRVSAGCHRASSRGLQPGALCDPPPGPPSTCPPPGCLHAGVTLHSFCGKSVYCLHGSESYHLEAGASEGVAMEMNFLS